MDKLNYSVTKALIPGGVPHEGTAVNTVALRERAYTVLAEHENRTLEQRQAAFERRREIASLGGVADLTAIEGDYMLLNLFRDSPTLDFVEVRDLPLGTIPIYRTRTEYPVGIFQSGLAGHGASVMYSTKDTAVQVTPFTYQTDEVTIPNLNNIYDMERLAQRTTALRQLAKYKEMATTNIALNTVFGAADVIATDPAAQIVTYFSGGGSFSGKAVYYLDPGVQSTSVPSVNIYDLTSEGGITKKVFQTLTTHAWQIGRSIRKIYVPTAGAPWQALQNQASIVAYAGSSGNQDVRKAITAEQWSEFQKDSFAGSMRLSWFGENFEIQKQNWLPSGYCFVVTEEPAAIMWNRLSLTTGENAEGTLETPVNGYYSRRSEAENIAVAQPEFCLRNFLVIKIS